MPEDKKKSGAQILRDMMSIQCLPGQLRAVLSEEPLTVVSAGAGTGKTWTLAWRFVWTALTRAKTNEILTLTFTDKAAGEMRERIRKLMMNLRLPLHDSDLEARLDESLSLMDEAYVSTIHSFSLRVIRECGLVLPVDPVSRLVSAPEEEEFWTDATDALDRLDGGWFASLLSGSARDEARKLIESPQTTVIVNAYQPTAVIDFARGLLGLCSSRGQTPTDLAQLSDGVQLDQVLQLVEAELLPQLRRAATPWENALNSLTGNLGPTQLAQNLSNLHQRWDHVPEDHPEQFIFEAADAVKGARGKLAAQLAAELGMPVKDWRSSVEGLRPGVDLYRRGWTEPEKELRRCMLRLAALCWQVWQAFKVNRGCITFDDMIHLAGEALARSPRYAARFKEILVDEFQDTNGMQDGLLKAITAASGGRLFIVGDLKQSIYRFRHAEPKLLDDYARRASTKSGGCYVPLDVSFRSSDAVLQAINSRFATIWKDGLGRSLNQACEPLLSPRSLQKPPDWIEARQSVTLPACERIFEAIRQDDQGKMESIPVTRTRLIERLGERLTQLKSNGTLTWDGKETRPLRWNDIAVLVPTRTYYEPLRWGLTHWNIPVRLEASISYYARTEVRDCAALVQFLANPADDVALAGFLCSPFSGLTLERGQQLLLQLHQTTEKPTPLLDRLADLEPATADWLKKQILACSLRGASAAIADLLAHQQWLERIAPRKRAPAVANLRRAVSLLEDYESSIGRPPQGAAVFLSQAMSDSVKQPEAQVDASEDALSVMTVHASKGLEFPLVVLMGLDHNKSGREDAIIPSIWTGLATAKFPEGWLEVCHQDKADKTGTAEGTMVPFQTPSPGTITSVDETNSGESNNENCRLKMAHSLLDQADAAEERQRLYYVALTRAKDGLILCGALRTTEAKTPAQQTWLTMESACAVPIAAEGEPGTPVKPEAVVKDEAAGRDITLLETRPQHLTRISATSWELWHLCPAAWRVSQRQGLDLDWSEPSQTAPSGNAPFGTEMGTLAHWILQNWDFTPPDLERLLSLPDGLLPPELRPLWRSEKGKQALAGFGANFRTAAGLELSSRLRHALALGDLQREYPFRMDIPGTRLIGAVDVFWIERDSNGTPCRVCIRDYKTTQIRPESHLPAELTMIETMYADQLRFYGLAVRGSSTKLAGLPLDLAVWYLREGAEHHIEPLSSAEEADLVVTLSHMAEQAAIGPWPARFDRCASCPHRRSCPVRLRENKNQPTAAEV